MRDSRPTLRQEVWLDGGGVEVCVVRVEGGRLKEVGEDALEELFGEVGELEGHRWWCSMWASDGLK